MSEEDDIFDVDDAFDSIGFGPFQRRIVAVAGLFIAADAMEMMILSFLGPTLRCQWEISESQESLLTTVVFLGMMIGTYFWGYMGDRIGRKKTLLIDSILTFTIGMLSAFAPNFESLLVIRALLGTCLGGFGIGISYLMEVVPRDQRGKWGVLIQLFWTVGTIVESILAWIFLPMDKKGWRILLGVSAIPILGVTFCICILPESPRYLLIKGHDEAALRVLKAAADENGSSIPQGHLKHTTMKRSTKSIANQLFGGKMCKTTVLLWFIWFTVALTYYGIVLMTTATSLHDGDTDEGTILKCDPSNDSPFKPSDFTSVFVASTSEVPGVVAAYFLIDRIGRKRTQSSLLVITAMSIFLMELFGKPGFWDTTFLFFARGSVEGAFVTTIVYTPEIYPTAVRTTGFGVANSVGRIGGMVSPFVGQNLLETGRMFLAQFIFGLLSLISSVFATMLPTETSGQKLEEVHGVEIDEFYADPIRLSTQESIDVFDTPSIEMAGPGDGRESNIVTI